MGVKEDAVALKDEGNKAIAQKDWKKAIEFYTKAIELDDTQAIFYSNRAQVRFGELALFTLQGFLRLSLVNNIVNRYRELWIGSASC